MPLTVELKTTTDGPDRLPQAAHHTDQYDGAQKTFQHFALFARAMHIHKSTHRSTVKILGAVNKHTSPRGAAPCVDIKQLNLHQ